MSPTAGGVAASGGASHVPFEAMTQVGQSARVQVFHPGLIPRHLHHLHGAVAGQDSVGNTLVQTPIGQIRLALPQVLPPETLLTLAQPESFHSAEIRHRFVALEALLSSLGATAGSPILPRPNSQMGSALLFFLVAMRQGGLRSWFGENYGKAAKKSPRQLAKAETELTQAQNPTPRVEPGWQTFTLPLQAGHELIKLMFYWRGSGRQKNRNPDEDATVFAVEGHQQQVGRFRLDGQYHRPDLNLQFSSDRSLVSGEEIEIQTIVQNAALLYGIQGQITFYTLGDHALWMEDEPAREMFQI